MKFFSKCINGEDPTEVRVDEDTLTILSPRNLTRPISFAQAARLRNTLSWALRNTGPGPIKPEYPETVHDIQQLIIELKDELRYAEIELVKKLKAKGYTNVAIAKKINKSEATVRRMLKK